MSSKTVFVTGANGYIGNAVAKAFRRAGWKTFGLVRDARHSHDLASHEIIPVIGSPGELDFLTHIDTADFDVIVSNTEDVGDPVVHFEKVRSLINALTQRSHDAGKRALVMFTSGCKDYGKMDEKDGDPGLLPHTETSVINPPPALWPRCNLGLELLHGEHAIYDAVVLRPTIVYGNSSSHYGALFDIASKSDTVLQLNAFPNAIMHSLHVDDCGDAYVALAEHPNRAEVAQQAFNISNAKYETAQQVGEALARSYGLELTFVAPAGDGEMGGIQSLVDFSQWVGSDHLRAVTGWRERRVPFVEGIDEYRMAYDARKSVR